MEKFQPGEEEEEKEQCSPVSVLDPPFEDDEDGHENDDEDDGFDLDCSYAIVQSMSQNFKYVPFCVNCMVFFSQQSVVHASSNLPVPYNVYDRWAHSDMIVLLLNPAISLGFIGI